jgi:hypothetical protein
MEVMHERCAGLDVHKETVVGCVRVREGGDVRREVRGFGENQRVSVECSRAAESGGRYRRPRPRAGGPSL